MTTVAWHPLARRELFEASDYYEAEAEGLGDLFFDAVQRGLDLLKAQPRAGQRVLRETRRYVIARFPYSLVYRLGDPAMAGREDVFILAVSHHKREPRYWAARR